MKKTNSAFTLIELLVVIAIIAILAAILFPVFAQAKQSAKQAASLSNVKQITTAQFLYMGDWDDAVAPNRDCNLVIGGVGGQIPCQTGRGMRGWIDLVVPYVKNYGIFKSPMDTQTAVPLPAGTLHWDGTPLTNGLIWGSRGNSPTFTPLGGDFRSSYARNNNFANNGTYTSTLTSAEAPANLVLIYSFAANSGAGAAGNEGVSGSSFTIVRRPDVTPASGTCVAYNNASTQNNRSNFFSSLPWYSQNTERTRPSSERYNGRAIYGFADGHAKVHTPERVLGQCGWGTGTGGTEFGNNGQNPDFRF